MFQFDRNIPEAEQGFGLDRNKYMSGRLGVTVGGHRGITEIRYYGRQRLGAPVFFKADAISSFDKLFRFQVLIDGKAYFPEFHHTRHYSCGFRSECTLASVRMRHELAVLEDAVVQRVVVLDNPGRRRVSARLLLHNYTRQPADKREWTDWTIDEEGSSMTCTALGCQIQSSEAHTSLCQAAIGNTNVAPDGDTFLAAGGNRRLHIYQKNDKFKYYLAGTEDAVSTSLFVLFGYDKAAFPTRLAELRETADAECDAAFAAYEAMLEAQTAVETGSPIFDSALANAVPAVLSLQVRDRPGAIRASQDYWVWGWDSLVHADAHAYNSTPEVIREMLAFYRDTACPEHGIYHALGLNFKPHLYMAFNAQCLYVTTLYNYFAATGDLATVREFHPFAKWILEKTAATVCGDTGLSIGVAHFPDFPECLDQTGRDLCILNNSLYYQALRGFELLSHEIGETAYAEELAERSAAARRGFETLMFDREKGYWYDSLCCDDLAPRRHYPLYAMLWVTPFAAEPGMAHLAEISGFMQKNFPFPNGLYTVPAWDSAFMADGNQIGSYYPAVDRYFWNMMNLSRAAGASERFETMLANYWSVLNYPEGLTHETENADPTFDNPGCKQAFSSKSWYCDFFEMIAGVRFDSRGISVNPMSAKPFTIRNWRIRGRVITLSVKGSGRCAALKIAGKVYAGTTRIDWEEIPERCEIEVLLSARPLAPTLAEAGECRVKVREASAAALTVEVQAPQLALLRFYTAGAACLEMDGAPIQTSHYPELGAALLWLPSGTHTVTLHR